MHASTNFSCSKTSHPTQQTEIQKTQIEVPQSKRAKYHGHLIRFERAQLTEEVIKRGLGQLLIKTHIDFHNFVREPLGLPKLGPELEMQTFTDDTFCLTLFLSLRIVRNSLYL